MTVEEILSKVDTTEVVERYPNWCENNPEAIRSAKKEIIGERLSSYFSIFSKMYNERAKKVVDLKEQKSGIDYKTYTRKIDIKVSIGDYRDDYLHLLECIPIELKQNKKITFTDDKATTDLLFINVNVVTNKITFTSIPFDLAKNIVKINLSNNPFQMFSKLYEKTKHESYNRSGIFIKMPIKTIFNYPGVIVQEYPFDENIL